MYVPFTENSLFRVTSTTTLDFVRRGQ